MDLKVLVADDHAIVRRGVVRILGELAEIVDVDEAANGEEVLRALQKNDYDLLLLDIAMPQGGGLEVLEVLRGRSRAPRVLILSMYPEKQYALRALRLGADGYLTKDSLPEELLEAIKKVAAGGKYVSQELSEELVIELSRDRSAGAPHESLSGREFEVMCLLGHGINSAEIAVELNLSRSTIATYRRRILKKLGVDNTAGIIRYAIQHHLVE